MRFLSALLTLCLFALPALAQDAPKDAPKLKVGDPAPKLAVSKWVKGDPIPELAKGKVYVIECWATWCGPCRAAMPHVTALQAKYKDKGVVVIGMNVWERDLTAVAPFVKQAGDKMGYAVAMDVVENGGKGTMAETWLAAAGRNGIPCSFLVDRQGKIAWIGHPMMMERPLSRLADDKFDPAEQAEFDKKLSEVEKEFGAAMRAKDYDKALSGLDDLAKLDPTSAAMREPQRLMVLVMKGDYPAANALAKQLTDGVSDPLTLGRVASLLLSAPDKEKIDAALALQLAQKAVEKAAPEDFSVQALLARAYAANQQFAKAAKVQEQALKKLPAQAPAVYKQQMEKDLESYKAKADTK